MADEPKSPKKPLFKGDKLVPGSQGIQSGGKISPEDQKAIEEGKRRIEEKRQQFQEKQKPRKTDD